MSIKVKCAEHLERVKKFSEEIGKKSHLEEKIDYLSEYGNGSKCLLFLDIAPYSFYFEIFTASGDYWFNGGLIYHDYNKSWGIHT